VPVVQLSINAMKPFDYHLELGAKLAPLRDRGVMIVGSGNVVHNLQDIDRRLAGSGFDWAQRFDDAARSAMTDSPSALPRLVDDRDFDCAVPTPDHFIPLLYLAGVASASNRPTDVLVDGCTYGSLSMTAYTLDLRCPSPPAASPSAGDVPDPAQIPADGTNM
jgi:4,5-DOPA dioxygenase extradiol